MEIPTLVIGTGRGGISIVQTYAEMVNELKIKDYYQFIAIDSSTKDLDAIIKRGYSINAVNISEEGYAVPNLIPQCQYLYDGIEPKGVGAIRDRVYARFLLDLNMDKVDGAITDAMAKMLTVWQQTKGSKTKEALIWVVHTLGGGTGSGSFPTLIAKVRQLSDGILKESGMKPFIFCIGILPSATNINDISTAKFDKKYTANSYAALREIKKLHTAKDLTIVPFNPARRPKKEIPVKSRPFDRYFLFGINEDLLARMKDDKDDRADEVEEYLDGVNKTIAYTMLYLPHYPGGLENMWHNQKDRPFTIFGESELTIPLEDMRKYAQENDTLGKAPDPEKKKRLDSVAETLAKSPTDDLNESRIEEDCLSIAQSERLRCLKYFVGQVQHEFDKELTRVEIQFSDNILRLGESLKRLDWAAAGMQNFDNQNIEDKYRQIVRVVKNRIEDNQKFIDSPFQTPRIFERKKRSDQNEKNSKKLRELEIQYDRFIKIRALKKYIDTSLGKKLVDVAGIQDFGAGNIAGHIRKREARLELLGNHLIDSGIGRVIRLGVPEDKVTRLTLEDPGGIRISEINSMAKFIGTMGIENAKVESLIKNRIDLASNYTIKVAVGLTPGAETGFTAQDELVVVNHENNDQILKRFSNLMSQWNLGQIRIDGFDNGRLVFMPFQVGVELEQTKDFVYRENEYQNGELAKIIGIDNIGIIFAHPEWFPEDEVVRRAYPKIFSAK
ncbi:MAG: hypothetical protein A4E35_00852 [Methanoregula sp. PtaU1.Bin051]|nr:MAG: hypothetical protein A4E35_00852 [Methanoregula sp. PtaU1.Bin051]